MRPVSRSSHQHARERKNVGVAGFSSEADYEGSNAVNALDGDERTFGTATGPVRDRYAPVSECRPGPATAISPTLHSPRQDGGTNGDIFEAEILVSDAADGYEMSTAVSVMRCLRQRRPRTHRPWRLKQIALARALSLRDRQGDSAGSGGDKCLQRGGAQFSAAIPGRCRRMISLPRSKG